MTLGLSLNFDNNRIEAFVSVPIAGAIRSGFISVESLNLSAWQK